MNRLDDLVFLAQKIHEVKKDIELLNISQETLNNKMIIQVDGLAELRKLFSEDMIGKVIPNPDTFENLKLEEYFVIYKDIRFLALEPTGE